ncbi:GH36-type glycosyl hydrolase domain-containing protein [Saccharibacillus sp. JS10]|uniref:GH36-type glycosyl hydrolase domain-containing protein n=1 Tax=Saccharibacillus sp. JS10 TaxID=2950552 RepID=UPI00210B4FA7|nr:cellobiose phosphorylase [Saccharibacillus sp. JS10]MCQ4086780.1 cellobiose phosphorylase [Saccharibacillus sp. JS10]
MATIANTNSKFNVQAGNLNFTFWPSGDLYQATGGKSMLNQLLSSPLDGSLNNIYLRIHEQSGITFYPLLGIHSSSTVRQNDKRVVWEGQAGNVEYKVTFAATQHDVWFWDIQTSGKGVKIDIVYAQDIGDADPGAVRSNEAYLSQYIDHAVFQDSEKGYIVCSRQNQPQGGAFPYMQQGSLTRAVGYSTDGFQFFGKSYKETNVPEALTQEKLVNEVYQYEFAYTALQSELVELNGEQNFVFYGLYRDNHPSAITEIEYAQDVQAAWEAYQKEEVGELQTQPSVSFKSTIGEPLQTLDLSDAEVEALFPNRYEEERENGKLLAFFTDTYEHIVLKEKERLVERPHGHILMSGGNVEFGVPVLASTAYMYGIFNSQLVLGNTNFNKMMSNARNALNVPKTAGQRIYIELDGQYRLLTMPSMFEIGFNYARWTYKMESDTIFVTTFTTVDSPEVRLEVRSQSGKAYTYLVTTQVTMNVNEYEFPLHMTQKDGQLVFKADTDSLSATAYPNLTFVMQVDGAKVSVHDESALADGVNSGDASLVALNVQSSAQWTLTIQGLLDGKELPLESKSLDNEIAAYRNFYQDVMNGFRLSKDGEATHEELFKVNALAWWYTHNMLVHYSSPHGLEQYGGAAWGTRDVCQGPVEYFMATQKYGQVKDILKTVYSHQYEDDGAWPQWFMFDQYFAIQQEESHGDIIVWPLKVLGDYLQTTRDFSILEEQVPYTVKHKFGFTEESYSILDHAKKEIQYIKNNFLHDTFLSSYGDGDWDDTLQPANAQLKQYMVSSWTVALTYQTVNVLSAALGDADSEFAQELANLAEGIRSDFNRYMLNTDVIPGFVYMEEADKPKPMLHPSDEETGIHYRLLPMTRSMIGELLTPEQAKSHYELIKREFYCPDGVRLMNRPAQYAGGVSTHFKRAEQASNFGREIGLQYVHAHIRYVEAMAKLGLADETWNGLAIINPVGIRDVVPNAELRQSNSYFSSSDGKFNNRYEAQDRFGELKSGDVAVKGGWRIYSSGPGIYMNQLIGNVLGIRQEGGDLIVDPVLPASLNGLHLDFSYDGIPATFIYRIGTDRSGEVTLNGQPIGEKVQNNRYREGGLRISRSEFERLADKNSNQIEIFV